MRSIIVLTLALVASAASTKAAVAPPTTADIHDAIQIEALVTPFGFVQTNDSQFFFLGLFLRALGRWAVGRAVGAALDRTWLIRNYSGAYARSRAHVEATRVLTEARRVLQDGRLNDVDVRRSLREIGITLGSMNRMVERINSLSDDPAARMEEVWQMERNLDLIREEIYNDEDRDWRCERRRLRGRECND